MRHTQKALQTDTAILFEKLLHMFASFGRSALLKPRRERLQADWPQVGIPLTKNSTLLAKFILRAGEQRIRHILIHQDILCRVPHLCTCSNALSATASHSSGVQRRRRGTSRTTYVPLQQCPSEVSAACRSSGFLLYTHCSCQISSDPIPQSHR